MILGNSGGKNKGKKYLKITGGEPITPENRLKASLFAQWFGVNYAQLQREPIYKGTHDEDTVSETFLRIYDKILYGGLDIADYKAYFHRALFTNYMQNLMRLNKSMQMFVPTDRANELTDISIESAEMEAAKKHFCSDILSFVQQKYDQESYSLFSDYLYMGSKEYLETALESGISKEKATGVIAKIKRSIKNNNRFLSIRNSI